MMKSRLFILILIGIFLASFASAYSFSGGNGTSINPYQITNWTGLNATRDDLTAYYILMNNLTGDDLDYISLGNNWTPIGTCGPEAECWSADYSYTFTGNFDGNSNTISDLVINQPDLSDVGLFGVSTGNISNIGLIDINVTGYQRVAGLVGYQLDGSIINSYSVGTIFGYNAGGLVGVQYGSITNSYSTGNVSSSDSNAGGLVGLQYGFITNSYSTGSVTGVNYIGGLVGAQWGGFYH